MARHDNRFVAANSAPAILGQLHLDREWQAGTIRVS